MKLNPRYVSFMALTLAGAVSLISLEKAHAVEKDFKAPEITENVGNPAKAEISETAYRTKELSKPKAEAWEARAAKKISGKKASKVEAKEKRAKMKDLQEFYVSEKSGILTVTDSKGLTKLELDGRKKELKGDLIYVMAVVDSLPSADRGKFSYELEKNDPRLKRASEKPKEIYSKEQFMDLYFQFAEKYNRSVIAARMTVGGIDEDTTNKLKHYIVAGELAARVSNYDDFYRQHYRGVVMNETFKSQMEDKNSGLYKDGTGTFMYRTPEGHDIFMEDKAFGFDEINHAHFFLGRARAEEIPIESGFVTLSKEHLLAQKFIQAGKIGIDLGDGKAAFPLNPGEAENFGSQDIGRDGRNDIFLSFNVETPEDAKLLNQYIFESYKLDPSKARLLPTQMAHSFFPAGEALMNPTIQAVEQPPLGPEAQESVPPPLEEPEGIPPPPSSFDGPFPDKF